MPMDVKDVEAHGRTISKTAAAGGDNAARLLTLIDDLRKGVKASEELLRQTKIGVIVNKLRQHKDRAVANQAHELVSKWRADVKRAGTGSSTPKTPNGTASPAPAATPTTALPKSKAKHNVAPESRNHKTDKVDLKITGVATRDNCIKLMYDGLAYMSDELPDVVLRSAREVEQAAYNAYQPETSEPYKAKMRSLYQNLKNKSNPKLRQRVLSGEIPAKKFVVMSHDELKSEDRKAEDARLEKENMSKAMVAQEEKSVSTSLQCGKCGQKKVSYNQAQTRSADEPMTTFCECLNCGNRWKFS